jgi:BlaI family transcriptional regulator, penicillinase repressor
MEKTPELSRAEYDILHILWKGECRSVREVHDRIHETTGWAYTTTKTMMDRMVQKGMLLREEFHGVFLYKPLISRPAGLVNWIKFFSDRVLELDSREVVAMFSQSKALTPEEITELERLIQEDSSGKK